MYQINVKIQRNNTIGPTQYGQTANQWEESEHNQRIANMIVSDIHKLVRYKIVAVVCTSRSCHTQTVYVECSRANGENGYELVMDVVWLAERNINVGGELTMENNAANMELFCTLMYLLLCKIGFWYHGTLTLFIDRDFWDAKLVDELKIV